MTISTEAIKTSVFDGNGSTTAFAFAFKTFLAADLVVTLTRGSSSGTSGAEETETIITDYTVALNSNQDSAPGGTVTMVVAPAAGSPAEKLVISNEAAYTQGVDLVSGGAFNANVIEDAIDRNTILARRAQELTTRSIQIPITDDTGTTVSLPTETLRASKALVFDASGNVSVSVDNYVDQVATVAASAAAAAASAAAALVSEGLADADAIQVAADLVATNQDTIDTAADLVATNQDTIDTAADLVATNQDTIDTAADVVTTAASAAAAAADLVLTNADVVLTHADVVLTNADVVSTNADVVLTNADVVTTGEISGAVALPYVFNTTTTMADPAGTFFRLNSATPASVTAIAFGDTTSDAVDLSSWLADWADSTSTLTGTIRIVQQGTPAKTIVFNVTAVTDNTDWLQVTVQHVSGASIFTSAATCRVTFTRTGDKGDTGSTGLTGATGAAGADGEATNGFVIAMAVAL